MSEPVLKVLVVDHQAWFHNWMDREFRNKGVNLISAFSLKEAEEKLAADPDIAAILLDTCSSEEYRTATDFVKKVRKSFTGPMIATCTFVSLRERLKAAGCNDGYSKDGALIKRFTEILPSL